MLSRRTSSTPQAASASLLTSYYILLDGQEAGPYSIAQLQKFPQFTLRTPVRTSPDAQWMPAFQAIDLKSYFARPSRSNGFLDAVARTSVGDAIAGTPSRSGHPRLRRFVRRTLVVVLLGGLATGAALHPLTHAWVQTQKAAALQHVQQAGHDAMTRLVQALQRLDKKLFQR